MNKKLALAVALAVSAGAAQAQDGFEYHGYTRSGVGMSSEGGKNVCFNNNGAWAKYRLGNECETYGELAFDYKAFESDAGVVFKSHHRIAWVVNANQDWEQFEPSWRESWFEGTNVVPGVTFWAGKRFYRRHDIHINDFYFHDRSGAGAGVEGFDFGVGKFAYASFFRSSSDTTQVIDHDFRLYDVDVGMGKLELGVNFGQQNDTDADERDGNAGWMGTGIWEIGGVMGGFNKASFQYGTDGNAQGGMSEDDTIIRFTNQLVIQPSDEISGMFVFIYQATDDGDVTKDWISLGARPQYHFNDYFSVAAEYGLDINSEDDVNNDDSWMLHKFTVAPQLSAGRNFWARPSIRAFLTYAAWDEEVPPGAAARFDGDTSGMTYGFQAEAWW